MLELSLFDLNLQPSLSEDITYMKSINLVCV